MSNNESQPDPSSNSAPESSFIVLLSWVDYVTLSSVVTTSLAVSFALEGRLFLATALLFLAMLADACDGILARKYGLVRAFGRYLDGFMDVLIYLVTPSIIWYLSGFSGWYGVFLMIMIATGCIRLSVFNEVGNIEESDGLSYLGMPVFWSVFILAVSQLLSLLLPATLLFVLLAITLSIFSCCMLYRGRFFKFKSMKQIYAITLGGASIFLLIDLYYFIQA